jgi:exodeoxyribonuclease VII small subunit
MVDKQPQTFEEMIAKLAEVVAQLEQGDLPLAESLGAFEQGMAIAREAEKRLDEAQTRIDELVGIDADGRVRATEITKKSSGEKA